MPDGGKITSLKDVVASLTQRARMTIAELSQNTWFGPSQPLPPMAPENVRGRQWDYPFGFNLNYIPRSTELVKFDELRALADNLPLLRLVIETRKDQIESLPWAFRVKNDDPSAQKKKIQATADQNGRLQDISEFFRRPDGEHPFATWMRVILEDMLVIDAAVVYPRPNLGGGIYAFEYIDGATIKPLLGHDGRRPEAPDPAFQQVLHGIPATDFTRDQLLYLPRNVRANRVYGYCFAPGTEILTREGWTLIDGLSYEDQLATRHPTTHEFQWQSPIALTERQFSGDLVQFSNGMGAGSVDVLVTPEHKMIVRSEYSGREQLMPAEELAGKSIAACRWRIPLAADSWNGVRIVEKRFANEEALRRNVKIRRLRGVGLTYQQISEEVGCSQMTAHDVVSGRYAYDGSGSFKIDVLSGDNFCAFMGMYLSEGSTNKDRIVVISQTKSPTVGKFQAKLAECFGLVEYDGREFRIHRTRVAEYVAQFGKQPDRFVPEEIMNATSEQIEIFLEYLFDGDAHRNKSGQTMFYTTSVRLADQVQELCQKIGKPASITKLTPRGSVMADGRVIKAENCRPQYRVSVNRRKFVRVLSSRVPYEGPVHCVSVPNKSVLVRRNGRAAWTSQSPVEQIILTVNTSLRREIYNLEYYNSGTVPQSFGTLPKEWGSLEIRKFQKWFDNLLSGNLRRRSQMRFMPSDFKYQEVHQNPMVDKYDEWLARIICYAFSVPVSPFVSQVNRATAQTMQVQAASEGLEPLKLWITHLMNELLLRLDQKDIEFAWSEGDTIDPQVQMATLTGYVAAGVLSRNEVREQIGEDAADDGDDYTVTGPALSPARLQTPEEQMAAHQQAMQVAGAKSASGAPETGSGSAGGSPPAFGARSFEDDSQKGLAADIEALLEKYSPDQPRDEHGRFARNPNSARSQRAERKKRRRAVDTRPRDENGNFIPDPSSKAAQQRSLPGSGETKPGGGGSSTAQGGKPAPGTPSLTGRPNISTADRQKFIEALKGSGERAVYGVTALAVAGVGAAMVTAGALPAAGLTAAALGVVAVTGVAVTGQAALQAADATMDFLNVPKAVRDPLKTVIDVMLGQKGLSTKDADKMARELGEAAASASKAVRAETTDPAVIWEHLQIAFYHVGQEAIAALKARYAEAVSNDPDAVKSINDKLDETLLDYLDDVDDLCEGEPDVDHGGDEYDESDHPVVQQKLLQALGEFLQKWEEDRHPRDQHGRFLGSGQVRRGGAPEGPKQQSVEQGTTEGISRLHEESEAKASLSDRVGMGLEHAAERIDKAVDTVKKAAEPFMAPLKEAVFAGGVAFATTRSVPASVLAGVGAGVTEYLVEHGEEKEGTAFAALVDGVTAANEMHLKVGTAGHALASVGLAAVSYGGQEALMALGADEKKAHKIVETVFSAAGFLVSRRHHKAAEDESLSDDDIWRAAPTVFGAVLDRTFDSVKADLPKSDDLDSLVVEIKSKIMAKLNAGLGAHGEIHDESNHPIVQQKLAKRAGSWLDLEHVWQAPHDEARLAKKFQARVHEAFEKASVAVSDHALISLKKYGKAANPPDEDAIAAQIGSEIPLDELQGAAGDFADISEEAARDVAERATARIGLGDRKDIVELVSEKAVAIARARAAELVGMRWDEESQSYIQNPNADMAISDATRDDIRKIIADGLEVNKSAEDIADEIQNATTFSEERANLVATTEIARVNTDAALATYAGAKEAGVPLKKRWLVAQSNVCDICTKNQEQGAIDLEEDFQSGDAGPPQHPNCRCAVSPVIWRETEENPDEEP